MEALTQRHQVIEAIKSLPDESIDELARFIEYLLYKIAIYRSLNPTTPALLDPNKTYEVWSPIEAPDAAKTLMSLLATT